MKLFKGMLLFAFCLSVIGIYGCASPQPKVGEEKVIEKSSEKRPEWITIPYFENKGELYFSGGVTGRGNYALGLRESKAEAMKNVAEGIQATVRTEFSKATKGSNYSESELGDFTTDAIAMITDNIKVQGVAPKENYFEKVEKTTASGVEYKYNCYTLLSMSKEDYKKMRDIALNGLADKAKKENNKKAEEMATSVLDTLKKSAE